MSNLPAPADLATLAAGINASHAAAESAIREGLAHALAAGEQLARAKAAVGHGGWLAWLRANVAFAPRTAQGYMRLHDRRAELGSKAPHDAHLTMRRALRMLDGDTAPAAVVEDVPAPDPGAEMVATFPGSDRFVSILPSRDHPGHYFIAWDDGGTVVGAKRPVRADGVAPMVRLSGLPLAAAKWESVATAPAASNVYLAADGPAFPATLARRLAEREAKIRGGFELLRRSLPELEAARAELGRLRDGVFKGDRDAFAAFVEARVGVSMAQVDELVSVARDVPAARV